MCNSCMLELGQQESYIVSLYFYRITTLCEEFHHLLFVCSSLLKSYFLLDFSTSFESQRLQIAINQGNQPQ